jgi:hypothetical protein
MYEGEKDNICNMPEIATIEIHKSKETGRYYIHYICHNWKINDLNFNAVDGLWTDKYIPKSKAQALMDFLNL